MNLAAIHVTSESVTGLRLQVMHSSILVTLINKSNRDHPLITMQQNDVLLHHVMRMTLMSLDILEQHSVIAPSDVSSIRGKLQTVLATSPPHQPQSLQTSANAPAPGMFHGHMDQGAPPALPPRQNSPYSVDDSQLDRAVALWDYGGSAPDDLNFKKDDVIVIDQESERNEDVSDECVC
jgi:hypothetical protein